MHEGAPSIKVSIPFFDSLPEFARFEGIISG
jgi:hypothetical protein